MSLAGLSLLSIEKAVVRGFSRRCASWESAAAPTMCDGSSCTCSQLSSPRGPFGAAARRELSALEGGWVLTLSWWQLRVHTLQTHIMHTSLTGPA